MANGKDVYYFSHDSNARNDEKILMLRAEHGWEGYGLYWALVEMMFESSDTALYHDKIKGLALSYNTDITLLQSVINTAISEGLFSSDKERFWSESLLRRKAAFHELRQKKSLAGKKGMESRWGSNNTVITEDNKGKERKGKERKKNSSNTNKFSPPTINEINQYCKERNNNIDAEKFHDFYQAKGWMVGSNKMKDWRAAVRTWEKKDNQDNKFNPPEHRRL